MNVASTTHLLVLMASTVKNRLQSLVRITVTLLIAFIVGYYVFQLVNSNTNFIYQSVNIHKSFQNPNADKVKDRETNTTEHRSSNRRNSKNELTVVTAYFNIGKFDKGGGGRYFTVDLYKHWGKIISNLHSPLVVYVDDDNILAYFIKLRQSLPNLTKIIKVDRTELWPFQLVPKIANLFKKPGYPRHPPNTVVPEYGAIMHSKMWALDHTSKTNPFNSEYFVWIDVGYYRDIVGKNKPFKMQLPPHFDKSKLGVNLVNNVNLKTITPKQAVYGNIVWVGGGCILGTGPVLQTFHQEYKEAVHRYLKEEVLSTDQQIMLSMFCDKEQKKHPTKTALQTFRIGEVKGVQTSNNWFYLGYLMYKET